MAGEGTIVVNLRKVDANKLTQKAFLSREWKTQINAKKTFYAVVSLHKTLASMVFQLNYTMHFF